MPIRSAASAGRFRVMTEMPSTVISPDGSGSRPLTHLMNVDFPLPDGPQTTTTFAFFTSADKG